MHDHRLSQRVLQIASRAAFNSACSDGVAEYLASVFKRTMRRFENATSFDATENLQKRWRRDRVEYQSKFSAVRLAPLAIVIAWGGIEPPHADFQSADRPNQAEQR
jgi:hypothetical protein